MWGGYVTTKASLNIVEGTNWKAASTTNILICTFCLRLTLVEVPLVSVANLCFEEPT